MHKMVWVGRVESSSRSTLCHDTFHCTRLLQALSKIHTLKIQIRKFGFKNAQLIPKCASTDSLWGFVF